MWLFWWHSFSLSLKNSFRSSVSTLLFPSPLKWNRRRICLPSSRKERKGRREKVWAERVTGKRAP
jgi:hypothetical protein